MRVFEKCWFIGFGVGWREYNTNMNKGDVKMYFCFTIGEKKYAFYEMVDLEAKDCREEHVLCEIWQYIRANGINVRYNSSIIDIIWNDGAKDNTCYKYLRDGNDFEVVEDKKTRESKYNKYMEEITDAVEFNA